MFLTFCGVESFSFYNFSMEFHNIKLKLFSFFLFQFIKEKKNASFWTFEYYQQFFDVETTQVGQRILGSMVPRPSGNYLDSHIRPNPDLYGKTEQFLPLSSYSAQKRKLLFWGSSSLCVILITDISIMMHVLLSFSTSGSNCMHRADAWVWNLVHQVKLYAFGWCMGQKFSASGLRLVTQIHMFVHNDQH